MQKIWKFTQVALENIYNNKIKSLLTMLGIIIGIAAVILIVSVGKSAEQLILSSIQSLGPRSIIIHPGADEHRGPPSPTTIDKIKYKDYLAVKNLNYVEDVSALLTHQAVVTYQNNNQNTQVVGTDENYTKIMNENVLEGRFFDRDDLINQRRVAVIGFKTADELFGDRSAVGNQIQIAGKSFQVVGIMDKQGTRFFQDFDSRVLMPLSTMKSQIKGVDYVDAVILNAKGDINETIDDLRVFMRKRHGIINNGNDLSKDDFLVISQVNAANTFQDISNALGIFLILIAGISLLVGGIGIMSIMLVTVSDRTREIGLRKAVGATNSDVHTQFLIEAIVLTLVAGVLGISLGVTLAWIAALILKNFQEQWQFIITFDSILLSFTISAMIGLVFGLYPAFIAARLNPIEALIKET